MYASINEAYGKDFKKKKSKKDKKKKKQSACHYYAQRYAKSKSEGGDVNIGGLDNSDMFSKYDKNAPNKPNDLYEKREDFIKANKDSLDDCDIEEEQDYFEKLYAEHDFRPMMSRNGDNLMNVEPTQYEEVKYDNTIKRSIDSNMNLDLNYNPSYDSDDDSESVATSLEAKAGTVIDTSTNLKEGSKVVSKEKEKEKEVSSTGAKPEYEPDKNYMDLGLYLISGILLIFILEQFVQIGLMMRNNRDVYNPIRENRGMNYMNGGGSGSGYVHQAPDQLYPPQMYNQQMYNAQMYNQQMYNGE